MSRKLLGIALLAVLVAVAIFAVSKYGPEIFASGSTGTSGGTGSGAGTGPDTDSGPAEPGGTSGDGGSGGGSSADAIPSDATEAVVEYVHDGDTLFLDDGRKVRLLGVNTPEIGSNLECYGNEATDLLRSLLPEGSRVWVEHDVEPLDQYGRSLLFVYTDAGTNVNLELLREGAAEVEMYKPNVLLRDEVYAAEDAARSAGLGLWGACR